MRLKFNTTSLYFFYVRNVLNEIYQHLAYVYNLDLSYSQEEKDANRYSRILNKWI
jgi:hypothetical protein